MKQSKMYSIRVTKHEAVLLSRIVCGPKHKLIIKDTWVQLFQLLEGIKAGHHDSVLFHLYPMLKPEDIEAARLCYRLIKEGKNPFPQNAGLSKIVMSSPPDADNVVPKSNAPTATTKPVKPDQNPPGISPSYNEPAYERNLLHRLIRTKDGKVVVRGTEVEVSTIVNLVKRGVGTIEILHQERQLKRADIEACSLYDRLAKELNKVNKQRSGLTKEQTEKIQPLPDPRELGFKLNRFAPPVLKVTLEKQPEPVVPELPPMPAKGKSTQQAKNKKEHDWPIKKCYDCEEDIQLVRVDGWWRPFDIVYFRPHQCGNKAPPQVSSFIPRKNRFE